MDLTFNLKALFERVHRVLKELLLVLVLLLDVWIDVTVACFLVFDETVKTLIDSHFQLSVVICILDHLVDSVLEVIDNRVVVLNDVTVGLYCLLDKTLADSEVLNHKAKTRVH